MGVVRESMSWASFSTKYSFYDRHNQYKEISPKRLTQRIVMSKMPSMNLPFYSVSRLSPVLGSNESNLNAIRLLAATGQL
jgi:hypothetical protein